MPREPPVTSAIRPLSENRSLNIFVPPLSCRRFWAGEGGESRKGVSLSSLRSQGRRMGTALHRCFPSSLPGEDQSRERAIETGDGSVRAWGRGRGNGG